MKYKQKQYPHCDAVVTHMLNKRRWCIQGFMLDKAYACAHCVYKSDCTCAHDVRSLLWKVLSWLTMTCLISINSKTLFNKLKAEKEGGGTHDKYSKKNSPCLSFDNITKCW